MGKLWRQRVLNTPHLERNLLELTERAERLGLIVNLVLQVRVKGMFEWANGELHGESLCKKGRLYAPALMLSYAA